MNETTDKATPVIILSRVDALLRIRGLHILAALALLLIPSAAAAAEAEGGHLGEILQTWWAIPFAGI
ncbi:MAG TPA: hypothetical protein VFT13_01210, partial [Candidatus Krumholzibacteria bacterium]|nr:hypothetical protein [Candidatus Krumholzibacteria bacterium]